MNKILGHDQGHQWPQRSDYLRLRKALLGNSFLFLALSTLKLEWALMFRNNFYHVNRRKVRQITFFFFFKKRLCWGIIEAFTRVFENQKNLYERKHSGERMHDVILEFHFAFGRLTGTLNFQSHHAVMVLSCIPCTCSY